MKNLTLIFVSSLILLQSMQIHPSDVIWLGDMCTHVQKHLKEGNDVLEFVSLHFGKKSAQHLPLDNHHKHLPFHHSFDNHILMLSNVGEYAQNETDREWFKKTSKRYFYINFYSFLKQYKFIQPPDMV
jgi:hypothetical protein